MAENSPISVSFSAELTGKIEDAAVSAARDILSGRRIIDVKGPYGLGLTALEVGNDDLCRQPEPTEASAVLSRALSLPMIYRRFSISKRRIAAFQELGQPLSLKMVEDAAQAVAMREEEFIYQGQTDFHLQGLLTAEGRNAIEGGNWNNVDEVIDNVIAAVNVLDDKGYRGPYGLALAPPLYNNLFRRYPGSDILQIEHLKRLCTGGITKAPIDNGVLISKDVDPSFWARICKSVTLGLTLLTKTLPSLNRWFSKLTRPMPFVLSRRARKQTDNGGDLHRLVDSKRRPISWNRRGGFETRPYGDGFRGAIRMTPELFNELQIHDVRDYVHQ